MFVRAAALVLGLASLLLADDARSQPDDAERAGTERVVLFPLAGELSASEREVFDALLLSELRAAKALELVPADVRQVHVEATRALGIACEAGAEASRACALEVGRLAAARWAIIGTSGSDPREVRLTLVDVAAEASAREVEASLPPSGESLSPVLQALVPDLLRPTAAGSDVVSGSDPLPGAQEGAGDPTLWWIGGGSLLAAGTLLALAAGGSFTLGAGQEAPLKAGEDPDARLAARDSWYAAGATLAVLGGAALITGAVLTAVGGVVAAE